MGLSATQTNIDKLLEKEPLTTCHVKPVWNNAGWLADSLTVIRNPKDGSYEHHVKKIKQKGENAGNGGNRVGAESGE